MFFKQININANLTDIDYRSYRLGTIGRGVYMSNRSCDTLWLIPNRCYPSREHIVISNRQTRHKAQYECNMMHDRVCSLSFGRTMRPIGLHWRFIRDRRFRSRRLHHLHLVAGDARVRSNFIPVFEVELSSTNSVSLEVNNAFGRQQRAMNEIRFWVWLASRLVG